jgi:hypothetical protein
MRTSILVRWVWAACAVLLIAAAGTARAQSTVTNEQLDQMLAPIALYPDALLSQVLMATTYPADVADAAAWAKANAGQTGDAAVKAVASRPWDPSVQSLVAFPQVLLQMGDNPKWVQDVGDAFLAEPERVMNQIQVLRNRAYAAGNLKTTEQQKVVMQAAPPAPSGSPAQNITQQTIIIEPAQPQVVYVPTYNPTVVYGAWPYPAYPPVYFPPPPGYAFGNALLTGIAFGTGIAITNALWGGFNWGRNDVNINVNRYNNINVNKRLDVNQNNVAWRHDPSNRRDVPYRDAGARQRYDTQRVAANKDRLAGRTPDADQFRGREPQRDASREKAQAALGNRGADPARGREQLQKDPQARQRASEAAKGADRDKAREAAQGVDRDRAKSATQGVDRDKAKQATQDIDRDRARAAAQNADREQVRQSAQSRPRDNALAGAGNATETRQAVDRGNASRESMKGRTAVAPRPQPAAAGGNGGGRAGAAKAASGPRAGGGGGAGRGGGHGGGRGR